MKPKIFFLILLTFSIIHTTSSIAEGTVRYVSLTGNNIPPYLSWEDAANSIQACINICFDGDTIFVANGVYAETLSVDKAVNLIGSSMDSTVIDGSGLGDITIRFNEIGSIENFNVLGKEVGTIQTATILAIKFIEVKFCRISDAASGVGFINSAIVHNNIITNTFYGCDGSPISDTCNIYIYNNLITLSNSNESGIACGISGTFYIDNNIMMYNNIPENSGPGISIGWPEKVYIRNNLISGFTPSIYFDLIEDTSYVENNLSNYSNHPDGGVFLRNIKMVVKNNIFSNNKAGLRVFGDPQDEYNLYWNNETNITGGSLNDSDIVADPMFVNDTMPTPNGNYDFHLQAFSPGIDKGDPNILDKDGTRSDIGMYGGPFGETYTYQDLSPLAPRNFFAVQDTNQILLKWNKNTEADTSHYNVYRGTVPDFVIDSTKLVTSITDTFFVEQIPGTSKIYVYKITCVDNQGNESEPSVERVINITSTGEYPVVIDDYLLYQNYPNPFNPSTTIGYKLISRAYVKLMVYDIKGELVSVLVNREQSAGYYEVEFNAEVGSRQSAVGNNLASGIYLYRIEIIGEGNIPVYSEMKKMILLK